MSRKNTFFTLLILTIIISISQLASSEPEQLHFTGGFCLKSDNVTPNGTYSSNILTLLSTLATRSSGLRFSTLSVGTGEDQVNGLYLCRPDISLETCQACLDTSTSIFIRKCTNKKEAILWHDECMLRYTNHSIFATEELKPWTYTSTYLNVSQPDVFPSLLNRTMQRIIAQAALPSNTLRFALGKENYTAFEGLYGMALCTPDITGLQCWDCLRTAFDLIPICCGGLSEATTVSLPSCQIRYDTAPFIFPWPSSTSSLSSPPPASG